MAARCRDSHATMMPPPAWALQRHHLLAVVPDLLVLAHGDSADGIVRCRVSHAWRVAAARCTNAVFANHTKSRAHTQRTQQRRQ